MYKRQDIIAYQFSSQNLVYYEVQGEIIIAEHTVPTSSSLLDGRIFVGDVNGDGFPEFALRSSLFINLGTTNAFSKVNPGFDRIIGLGDIDLDGDLDIMAVPPSSFGGPFRIYPNDGTGTFSVGQLFIDLGLATHVVVVDINQDGHMDMISARKNALNKAGPGIHLNDGNNQFTGFLTYDNMDSASAVQIAVVDIDNDSSFELIQAYGTDVDRIEMDLNCSIAYSFNGVLDTFSEAIITSNSWEKNLGILPVSYTHLTLPTICSV